MLETNVYKIFKLVMGGIGNFLSRLLKDKIPRYHGILPYSDFSIFYFTKFVNFYHVVNE